MWNFFERIFKSLYWGDVIMINDNKFIDYVWEKILNEYNFFLNKNNNV